MYNSPCRNLDVRFPDELIVPLQRDNIYYTRFLEINIDHTNRAVMRLEDKDVRNESAERMREKMKQKERGIEPFSLTHRH
jgi:hypothetical protein